SKAYTTRVGGGPFPTELSGTLADLLQARGHEYGATTGRPRRCGWFDAVVGRYAVRINGLDTVALTKLDVLDTLETVKVCTAYLHRGEILTEFPEDETVVAEAQPVYEELEGWRAPTVGARQPSSSSYTGCTSATTVSSSGNSVRISPRCRYAVHTFTVSSVSSTSSFVSATVSRPLMRTA